MRLRRICLLVLGARLALAGPGAHAATFQGLGDLPGGAVEGYAIGVSPDGQFVAGHSFSDLGDEAFVWSAGGGMTALGDLSGGAFDSFATMAADGGAVVVGYGSVNGGYRPFRKTSTGVMVVLGDLPGGGSNGFAAGMSADGSVICGQSTSASGTEAFRWQTGMGMAGLGDLAGGVFQSSAWAVSADGAAVVGDGATDSGTEAFLWTSAGGMVGLGYLPGGGTFSGAHGASSGGAYVVGASDSSSATPGYLEAFRWSSSGMVGLGDLPGGPYGSFANGVSADGRVVVGGSETATGTEAYFWTPECGMRNLKQHLLLQGAGNVVSWILRNAHGVSADGTTITGYGVNSSGQTEPWIAHIDPTCATGAGSVPDGASVPGLPLTVEKGAPGALDLYWSPSCRAGDIDYAVYEGVLGNFTSHVARACTTGGTTSTTLVPGAGNRYYLVVPHDGSVEGSYGTASGGTERPPSANACFAQAVGGCP